MSQILRFRAPGTPLLLGELLGHACPGLDPGCFEVWLADGRVEVAAERVRGLTTVVPPGAPVAVAVPGRPADGAAWPGLRARAGAAFVLVVAAPWSRGVLPAPDAARTHLADVDFECIAERDGVAELGLSWPETADGDDEAFAAARDVLARLADAGLCVLGDPWQGGVVVPGGVAWRSASAGSHADSDAWPEGPLFVEAPRDGARPAWTISDATARVLARGHPWIRLDAETDDPAAFRPGARVALVTRDGREHGDALVEGAGRGLHSSLEVGDVAGRIVARARGDWSIEACVARAVERRRALIDDQHRTDAFRLVHGEADGVPGLHVDRLGPLVRVLVTARCALPWVDRVLVALGSAGPRVVPDPWSVLEVVHLDERLSGRLECVRVHPYSADVAATAELGRALRVREAGLDFHVEPGLAEPTRSTPGTGLFLDQRENRAAMAARAREGGHYLNLFAHTGAFSVAWLAAGAESVVSVDLSAAYLRWLESNLAANAARGVEPTRHVSVRQDGRRYLERLEPHARFDGIVLDPPTAAAAGRRFFSVRRDAVPMIARCLAHLAPGGRLLVTLNDRKARRRLGAVIETAAREAGVTLASVAPAPPAPDFPSLEGFDEGDAFGGCLVSVP